MRVLHGDLDVFIADGLRGMEWEKQSGEEFGECHDSCEHRDASRIIRAGATLPVYRDREGRVDAGGDILMLCSLQAAVAEE